MNQDRMPENELLAKLLQKQPEAFRQLVEAEKHKVLNICYRFVHNREDAEDIAQEVFVEAHRSIAHLRAASNIEPWICRIAVSKSLNYLRQQRRQKRGGLLRRWLQLDGEAETVAASTSTDPLETLERAEDRALLRRALESLPGNQRIAFTLSKYDEISYAEIAVIMETTVPAVESLIHRAKTGLQQRLRHDYGKLMERQKKKRKETGETASE